MVSKPNLVSDVLLSASGILGVSVPDMPGKSLVELGGSSMDASLLAVALLRQHGLQVRAVEILRADDLAAHLADIAQRPGADDVTADARHTDFRPGDRLPLTWQQQAVWFQSLLQPDAPLYHFHGVMSFDTPPRAEALRAILAEALRKHPAMRIRLDIVDGEAWQVVPGDEVVDDEVELTEVWLETEPDSLRGLVAAASAERPFDLSTGPLVRWVLAHLPDGSAKLIHQDHHLIHDGNSFLAFLRSLGDATRRAPDVQYFRYAAAQQATDAAEVARLAAQYAGVDLSISGSPDGVAHDPSFRAPIPVDLFTAARHAARRAGVSAFTVLFAAFSQALARHQGRSRLVIGTAVENRPAGHADTVGMYVGASPVFMSHQPDDDAGTLLRRTASALDAAVDHADVPAQDLIRAMRADGRRVTSVIPAGFSLHTQTEATVRLDSQTARVEVGVTNGAKFPIDVVAVRTGDPSAERLEVIVQGDRNVVGQDDLWTLWSYFVQSLRGLGGPAGAVSTRAGRLKLVERVFAHARQAPDRPAFTDEAQTVSYQDLTRLGDGATELLGDGRTIGILGGASARFFATAFAVWRHGGTYVPLDLNQSPDGLAYIVERSGCDVVVDLAGAEHAPVVEDLLRRVPDLRLLGWPDFEAGPPTIGAEGPAVSPASDSPAYIIFTSGSTGRPKGVAVPRSAVERLSEWAAAEMQLEPGAVIGQGMNAVFDAAVFEIWSGLWAGVSMRIAPTDIRWDPPAFAEWIRAEGVTTIGVATPVAELLMQLDWPSATPLRILATGGDRLHPVRHGLPFRVLNIYGPTETTVAATTAWVEPGGEDLPPIGRMLPYAYARIVGDDAVPVGPGQQGELWIGGAGVACGYVGDEAQTAARFIPDPYSPAGDVVYRTGDQVRQDADGTLHFIGRRDRQVKIAGVRVELGEIESTALRQPYVRQAVAELVPVVGRARPHLFLVSRDGVDRSTLTRQVRNALPRYLHNIVIRVVDDVPIRSNGKLDIQRLLAS
jgi:amino acid adenylation domain-containing protein